MSRFVLSRLCHVLAREEGTLLGESQWRTRRLESRYGGEEVGGGAWARDRGVGVGVGVRAGPGAEGVEGVKEL